MPQAGHGKPKLADTAFRPRSLERANRALSDAAEPHGCEDQDVFKMTVRIEIEGEEMRVAVALERHARDVPAREFWTGLARPIAYARYERSVQEFSLGERTLSHRQRRLATARRR
jgi:hypothetical protein